MGHGDVTGSNVGCREGAQGVPSAHLQEVEHEGGHPAPAVQAVHVGDALGPVGLEHSDDACGEEPVTTRARPIPMHPPRTTARTNEGDEQRQAMEQRVQRLGGSLGLVPEHPVHEESCPERARQHPWGSPTSPGCCGHGDGGGGGGPGASSPVPVGDRFVPFPPRWAPRCRSPSPWRKTMPSTMHSGCTLSCSALCQATPPR